MPAPDEQVVLSLLRDRLLLPEAQLEGAVSPFYPDDVPDLWVAPVFEGDAGRAAVLYAPGGAPCAQAGLDRASTRLKELAIFDRGGGAWAAAHLRQLLDAVGGLGPGLYPFADEAPLEVADGFGTSFEAPAPWVRYAASGAPGIPPSAGEVPDPRGIAPPQETGTSVVTVGADHRLVWRYQVAGEELGRFEGHWSDDHPGPDEPEAVLSERLVAAVRRHRPSPLAVPARPPVRVRTDGAITTWSVELLGQEAVEINEAAGVVRPLGR